MGGVTLSEYLDNARPFRWGHNDCLMFVSGALRAQGLDPLPHEWRGDYTTPSGALRHYKRMLRRTGYVHILDAMDARYDRAVTLHPSDGMIAARSVPGDILGFVFGIVFRDQFVALSEEGLAAIPLMPGDIYWSVK